MQFDPKRAALHFRIWQYGNPRGWDCTAAEIAEELRISPRTVGRICANRKWPLRSSRQEHSGVDALGLMSGTEYDRAIVARYRERGTE
jgi:hypothetical protein